MTEPIAAPSATKRCPFCAEEIQVAAVVCKHCGRDLPTPPISAPPISAPPVTTASKKPRSPVNTVLSLIALAIFMTFAFAMCVAVFAPTGNRTSSSARGGSSAARSSDAQRLELVSWRPYFSDNWAYVEGQVKNISDEPIRSVTAVATWFTADATFVTSDKALIEYNPLMPGQTSPFKTMTRRNPLMKNAEIEFAELLGGTIPTRR